MAELISYLSIVPHMRSSDVPPKHSAPLTWGFFCRRSTSCVETKLPYSAHPSHDSQLMTRLAATITIPVMSTAKQENSRRSLTRKRIDRLPFNLPCAWPS